MNTWQSKHHKQRSGYSPIQGQSPAIREVLLAAVTLFFALEDSISPKASSEDREDARDWIVSDAIHNGSCIWCCRKIHINVSAVRAAIGDEEKLKTMLATIHGAIIGSGSRRLSMVQKIMQTVFGKAEPTQRKISDD